MKLLHAIQEWLIISTNGNLSEDFYRRIAFTSPVARGGKLFGNP